MELDAEFQQSWDLIRSQCPGMSKSLAFTLAKLKYQMVSISKEERLRRQAMFDAYEKSLAQSVKQMEERDPVKKTKATVERFEKEWAFFVEKVQANELIGDEKREVFVELVMDVLEMNVGKGGDPVLARMVVEKNFRKYSFPVVRQAVVSLVRSGDTGGEAGKYLGARCKAVEQTKGKAK